jgi:hypothetical protein
MTIDPKTLAWVNLATCAGMIYGPRVFLYNKRVKDERKKDKPDNTGPVPNFSAQLN